MNYNWSKQIDRLGCSIYYDNDKFVSVNRIKDVVRRTLFDYKFAMVLLMFMCICLIITTFATGWAYKDLETEYKSLQETSTQKENRSAVIIDSLQNLLDSTRIEEINIKINDVRMSFYNPTFSQCDSTPFWTGAGHFIDTTKVYRTCAASFDLFYTDLNYNDRIYVECGNKLYDGWYKVNDAMAMSVHRSLDLLLTPADKRKGGIRNCKITKIIRH